MMATAAPEIVIRVHQHGGELSPEGDLLRYRGPALTEELRSLIREHKAELICFLQQRDDFTDDPVACRGCAAVIPAGTTLCAQCGSARSPLVRFAVELSLEAERRTLRGRALIALDHRGFPKVRLADGSSAGPGLLSWCPVLREMGSDQLQALLRQVKDGRK